MVLEFLNPSILASQKVVILVNDSNFLAWKQYVLLVIRTYRLQSFIDGIVIMPPRVIIDDDGNSLEIPIYVQYEQ